MTDLGEKWDNLPDSVFKSAMDIIERQKKVLSQLLGPLDD